MALLFLGRDCDIDDSCKYVQFSDIWLMEVIRVSAHFLTSDFPYTGTTMVTIGMQKSDPTDPRSVSCEPPLVNCHRNHTLLRTTLPSWRLQSLYLDGHQSKGIKAFQVLFPFALNLFQRLLDCICAGPLVGSMRRWSANIEYPFSSLIQTNLDSKRF